MRLCKQKLSRQGGDNLPRCIPTVNRRTAHRVPCAVHQFAIGEADFLKGTRNGSTHKKCRPTAQPSCHILYLSPKNGVIFSVWMGVLFVRRYSFSLRAKPSLDAWVKGLVRKKNIPWFFGSFRGFRPLLFQLLMGFCNRARSAFESCCSILQCIQILPA